jgi:predicted Ser/Thr protein kinase
MNDDRKDLTAQRTAVRPTGPGGNDDMKTQLRSADTIPLAHDDAMRTQLRSSETIPLAGGSDDMKTQLRSVDANPPAGATVLRSDETLRIVPPTAVNAAPPASTVTDLTSEPATPSQLRFVPGEVIKDRFLLEHEIGRGGMGVVFAAVDRRKQEARDPNPRIAIKILNGDFERHPHALMALQREARKAQTLAHPNVVTVFDFDRDGSSIFMTMELLRGRSLDSITREARGKGIGREKALPIIRGIAEGLAYAHRKGIVHSDLKPGNVFVLEDGTPKLLDFGIARAIPSANTEQDVFDAGSLGAYTEAYATDEMIEGADPHPADDVYALGLIAYELLTGKHPYQRYSAPRARELGLKPPMPKELTRREARVLERCIALERAKRPKDAAEVLREMFGATRLQKTLVAATVVLALAAGVFAYRDYTQSGPAVAFESLPAEVQQQFSAAMSEGDASWAFFEREKNVVALYDAVDRYADAERLHPRNRNATRALRKAADAFLKDIAKTPEQKREAARVLAEKSEYLAKYPPVMDAL